MIQIDGSNITNNHNSENKKMIMSNLGLKASV